MLFNTYLCSHIILLYSGGVTTVTVLYTRNGVYEVEEDFTREEEENLALPQPKIMTPISLDTKDERKKLNVLGKDVSGQFS
jgi:hypothetical protein